MPLAQVVGEFRSVGEIKKRAMSITGSGSSRQRNSTGRSNDNKSVYEVIADEYDDRFPQS